MVKAASQSSVQDCGIVLTAKFVCEIYGGVPVVHSFREESSLFWDMCSPVEPDPHTAG